MSWPAVAFKDLGKWFGGGTPSKGNPSFWDGGIIPWLSPKDMGPAVLTDTQDHITSAGFAGSSVRLVPANSVAVVVRSGILERALPVALVPFETTLNQDMKAVAPRADIDPRWIAWGFRAFERELLTTTRKAGTTVASIEMPRFNDFKLPVPELSEQRRLVEILEDHFSRLDAGDEGLRRSLRRLAGLREQLLLDALTGARLEGYREEASLEEAGTNDGALPRLLTGWRWSRLGDVANVVGGVTKDAKKQADPNAVEVPYLRVANVQRGRLLLDDIARIRVPPAKAKSLQLRPGDVLLNEGGDRDKLARGWVWEGQLDRCIHQNHVFRARIHPHLDLDPYFLSWTANTFGGRWAERNGKQSVNLASISLTMIRQMPVILPPKGTSTDIARTLGEELDAVNRLADQCRQALRRNQALRRAILASAFDGKLSGRDKHADVIDDVADD